MQDPHLDRRQFSIAMAYSLLGGATIAILGCDSDDGTPVAPRMPDAIDNMGVISDNHGHAAVITGAQLMAGGALELNIQGNASHTHTVALSASEITTVRSGARVAKSSSTANSHSHTVAFN